MFPKEISKYVKNLAFTKDSIGRSDDQVYIFEDKYILKVSSNIETLKNEKEMFDFLSSCNVPGSQSVCYFKDTNKAYYLRTYINGDSLIDSRFINNPMLLIDTLVPIIKVLRSLDSSKCKIKSKGNVGNDFVHGDLCLPNILVDQNNHFVGFIDLGNAGLGDCWYDYASLLWSLEYNLKTKQYNDILLNKLGLKFDEEKYNYYKNDD